MGDLPRYVVDRRGGRALTITVIDGYLDVVASDEETSTAVEIELSPAEARELRVFIDTHPAPVPLAERIPRPGDTIVVRRWDPHTEYIDRWHRVEHVAWTTGDGNAAVDGMFRWPLGAKVRGGWLWPEEGTDLAPEDQP